jgi:hypothetical protein
VQGGIPDRPFTGFSSFRAAYTGLLRRMAIGRCTAPCTGITSSWFWGHITGLHAVGSGGRPDYRRFGRVPLTGRAKWQCSFCSIMVRRRDRLPPQESLRRVLSPPRSSCRGGPRWDSGLSAH